MILATVQFELGGQICTAHLGQRGWNAIHAPQLLNTVLNHVGNPSEFGPSDGDPIANAAQKIASTFKGRVTFCRLLNDPPDTVY